MTKRIVNISFVLVIVILLLILLTACKGDKTIEVVIVDGYSIDIIEDGKPRTEHRLLVTYEGNTFEIIVELKNKRFPVISRYNYTKGSTILLKVYFEYTWRNDEYMVTYIDHPWN